MMTSYTQPNFDQIWWRKMSQPICTKTSQPCWHLSSKHTCRPMRARRVSHLFYNASIRSKFLTASVKRRFHKYLPPKKLFPGVSQSEANAYWLIINCQYITSRLTHVTNKHGGCVRRIFRLLWHSGNNCSFYAESCSSEESLQYEEPRASSSSAEKRKLRSEKSNSSSKRSANQKQLQSFGKQREKRI